MAISWPNNTNAIKVSKIEFSDKISDKNNTIVSKIQFSAKILDNGLFGF